MHNAKPLLSFLAVCTSAWIVLYSKHSDHQPLTAALNTLNSSLKNLQNYLDEYKQPVTQPITPELKRLTAVSYPGPDWTSNRIKQWMSNFSSALHKQSDNYLLSITFNGDYIYIENVSLYQPKRYDLIDYISATRRTNTPNHKILLNNLINSYKIHLMPNTGAELMLIVETLTHAMIMQEPLKSNLGVFKFRPFITFTGSKEQMTNILTSPKSKKIFPLIILYPQPTRESAQIVLDTVYHLFKDLPGLDITPRYNIKITDLIYYAQGDGDYKHDRVAKYYNEDRTLYKPDFEGPGFNKDYALKNPALASQGSTR